MDVPGLVIAVVVLAASAHENTAGTALLDQVAATAPTVTTALVDQGSRNSIVAHGTAVGIDVQVVERNPADKEFVPPAKRRVAEQTFGILSFHRRDGPAADRHVRALMAGRVTADPDPGRHLLDRIGAREQALARETLIALAGEGDAQPADGPTAPALVVPDHPACQQILTAFTDLGRPLRARDLCVALDLPIAARHTENIRSKLKRLVSRGIFVETEPGLFAQPRP